MGDLIPLFALIDIALLAAALFDCITTDESVVRSLPKMVWILLILFIPTLGAIMWFIAGRPTTPVAARPRRDHWAPGNGFPEGERPARLAPDDDPDFLRDLAAGQQRAAERARREDEDRLRKWEADLRAREAKLRQPDKPTERD